MTPLRGFTGAFAMHLRLYAFHQFRFVTVVAQPAAMTAVALLVLRTATTEANVFRVLIGGALVGMWGAVVGTSFFTIRREREWYGTFSLLTVVPAPIASIFSGYLLAETAISLFGVAVSFGVGYAIVGGLVTVEAPARFAISLVLGGISVAALAILIAPLVLLLPVLTRWVNIFDHPVWILAGFLFPIAILPGWTSPLSHGLSVYWGVEALRRSAAGAPWSELLPIWAAILGLVLAYFTVSVAGLSLAVRRLRRTGELVAA
jgi:ABC-2 type transport system permease protein